MSLPALSMAATVSQAQTMPCCKDGLCPMHMMMKDRAADCVCMSPDNAKVTTQFSINTLIDLAGTLRLPLPSVKVHHFVASRFALPMFELPRQDCPS
jgi:hypothetical protein